MNPSWPRSNSVERMCLTKEIHRISPQFDPNPHQIFTVRRELSFLHKICPWDYSRVDQPREQRKARKPVNFLSLDICPLHPVELLDGVLDGLSFPNASLEDGVP